MLQRLLRLLLLDDSSRPLPLLSLSGPRGKRVEKEEYSTGTDVRRTLSGGEDGIPSRSCSQDKMLQLNEECHLRTKVSLYLKCREPVQTDEQLDELCSELMGE
ncbi:hypothetical protein NDU88_005298 [Pleurodeles waltl]|uniref:Uncharacterized protein n=1 Tax=Pleurodeles waltl TaxID=8319 RepID=A0AAV7ULP6_PLEWA|nr:hypothetical protein NDU88_005298 [Pleurodeles waltl]